MEPKSSFEIQADPRSWYYGRQFTEDELMEAGRDLLGREYISGASAMGGPILRPKITINGEVCVERSDGDITAAEAAPLPAGGQMTTNNVTTAAVADSKNIFLVHGHDTEARAVIARFIERAVAGGGNVTILDEQANSGRTIIEKFEQHASESAYAVVLLTPDDVGGCSWQTNPKPCPPERHI